MCSVDTGGGGGVPWGFHPRRLPRMMLAWSLCRGRAGKPTHPFARCLHFRLRPNGHHLCSCARARPYTVYFNLSRNCWTQAAIWPYRKAQTQFEFGNLNFAGGFHRFRFYSLRSSRTIFNAIFVSGMPNLFKGVRPAPQVQFFVNLRSRRLPPLPHLLFNWASIRFDPTP